jgi:hypothetical protein
MFTDAVKLHKKVYYFKLYHVFLRLFTVNSRQLDTGKEI